MSFEVFIPATSAHLDSAECSVRRLIEQGIDSDLITVVTPKAEDYHVFLGAYSIKVATDNDRARFRVSDISSALPVGLRDLSGWYFQQLLKYELVISSDRANVLVIDADTIILGNVFESLGVFGLSKERHAPYYEHYRLLMGAMPSIEKSAIVNFMWFNPAALRGMLSFIEEKTGRVWWEAILAVVKSEKHSNAEFSEYETYANWCVSQSLPNRCIDFHVFRRGDLLVGSHRNKNDVIAAMALKGYGAVAFEHAHARSFWKIMMAHMIYFFSLKYW